MLEILLSLIITISITQVLIIMVYIFKSKLDFKRQIENKLGKKIKFRDIK